MIKKLILLIIIFILTTTATTALSRDITLDINGSYEVYGKNITLIRTNRDEQKIIVCVNNKKGIVSDVDIINGVQIEIETVRLNSTDINIRYSCDTNCRCIGDCLNTECLETIEIKEEIKEQEGITSDLKEIISDLGTIEEKIKSNIPPIILIILLIIIIIVLHFKYSLSS